MLVRNELTAKPLTELREAVLERRPWLPTQELASLIDVCVCQRYIAGLMRRGDAMGRCTEGRLDCIQQVGRSDRPMATEVDEVVTVRRIEKQNDAVRHVIHECVVANSIPAVEQFDRITSENPRCELVHREIGALTRPIHIEEARNGGRKSSRPVMRMEERLAGDLRGRIGRLGPSLHLVLGEGRTVIGSIYGAR